MFALALIPALSPTRGAARRFWFVAIALVELLVFALYAVDFGHYEYLRARVNATLAEHLEPLDVALIVLWQSYPVALILFALAVCAFVFTALAARADLKLVVDDSVSRKITINLEKKPAREILDTITSARRYDDSASAYRPCARYRPAMSFNASPASG